MAGSWQHMTTRTGKLLNNENFTGMIENLGDAYEAAEECHGMIWWLAGEVARYRSLEAAQAPLPTREIMRGIVTQAERHYKDGLALGGVQRSR
jgi:hypothetical protein